MNKRLILLLHFVNIVAICAIFVIPKKGLIDRMEKLASKQMQEIFGGQSNYTREDWRTRYSNYIEACEKLPGHGTAFKYLPLELWVEEGEPEGLSSSSRESRWWIKYLINK